MLCLFVDHVDVITGVNVGVGVDISAGLGVGTSAGFSARFSVGKEGFFNMVGGNDPFGNLEAIKIRDSICPFIGVGSTSGVGSVTVDGRVDGVGSVSGVGTDVTNEAVITVVTVSCAFTLSVGRSEDIKAFGKSFILFFFRGCVEHDKDISGVIVDVSAGVNVIAFFCLRIGRIGCVGASGVGVVCGIGDDAGAC